MAANFKPVKTAKAMGNLADKWFALRDERLALDKKVAELKAAENAAKSALIQSLAKEKVSSVGGMSVKVELTPKKKPILENYVALCEHIKKTGDFDLLQKRLGEKAVKERWDNDVEVPGIGSYDYDDLSYSKLKN